MRATLLFLKDFCLTACGVLEARGINKYDIVIGMFECAGQNISCAWAKELTAFWLYIDKHFFLPGLISMSTDDLGMAASGLNEGTHSSTIDAHHGNEDLVVTKSCCSCHLGQGKRVRADNFFDQRVPRRKEEGAVIHSSDTEEEKPHQLRNFEFSGSTPATLSAGSSRR